MDEKDYAKYPVIHEIGHIFHNSLYDKYLNDYRKSTFSHDDFIDLEMKKIYTIYKDKYGLKEISSSKIPSKYFDENDREAFAELFVLSEIGQKMISGIL